jgi:5-methylcytosine-specific restriction endonuclease McrA
VDYAAFGGRLMERLIIRRDVDRIFSYRGERLAEIFPRARED